MRGSLPRRASTEHGPVAVCCGAVGQVEVLFQVHKLGLARTVYIHCILLYMVVSLSIIPYIHRIYVYTWFRPNLTCTHTHTHAHTHTYTRTHTHIHTHTCTCTDRQMTWTSGDSGDTRRGGHHPALNKGSATRIFCVLLDAREDCVCFSNLGRWVKEASIQGSGEGEYRVIHQHNESSSVHKKNRNKQRSSNLAAASLVRQYVLKPLHYDRMQRHDHIRTHTHSHTYLHAHKHTHAQIRTHTHAHTQLTHQPERALHRHGCLPQPL